MKKFAKLHTFLVGASVGMGIVSLVLLVLVLSGQVPWLKAAGVGTGAPDVNAGLLDGYGTSLSAGVNKVYISGSDNYLPANTVASSSIVDGTGSGLDADTLDGINSDGFGDITQIITTATSSGCDSGVCDIRDIDGAGSGLDADLLDGANSTSYTWPGDIACGAGFTDMGTYCIQTAEANSGTGVFWHEASDYCNDTYAGARLCTSSEWYNGCMNGGLTNIINGYEWVDSWTDSTNAFLRGNGSCTAVTYSTVADSAVPFRCCK